MSSVIDTQNSTQSKNSPKFLMSLVFWPHTGLSLAQIEAAYVVYLHATKTFQMAGILAAMIQHMDMFCAEKVAASILLVVSTTSIEHYT